MVALVGSGASADSGLPDWNGLCEKVMAFSIAKRSDRASEYQRLLNAHEFGELMEVFASDMGREELLKVVAHELRPTGQESEVHRFLASFPFAFYITTNYDDLLMAALRKIGFVFSKLYNTTADFSAIDVNTKDAVIKLHGDFDKPETVILTASDFQEISHGPSYEYFRTRLASVLTMFDVLAVGYSFRDPHLAWILEKHAVLFKGGKPLFAILSDAEPGDVAQFRRKYNVEVLSYKTLNGSHQRLLQRFKSIEPFISVRKPKTLDYAGPGPQQSEDANQLFLFTTFHVNPEGVDFKLGAYRALIVSALRKSKVPIDAPKLIASLPLGIPKIADKIAAFVDVTLKKLESEGIVRRLLNNNFELTPAGLEGLSGTTRKYELALEKFKAQTSADLGAQFVGVSEHVSAQFVTETLSCANQIFYLRGVEIAGSIFDTRHVSLAGGYDILRVINGHAAKFADQGHSLFFMQYLQGLVSDPNPTQQEYLWHLSQAYFSYHALNLDPACNKIQKDLLSKNLFIVDSNVVLPLLAEGTFNHSAAKQLFELVSQLGAKVCITKGVLREVVIHARFATAVAIKEGTDSSSFLEAALGRGGYRQNLFIDGFIRLSDSVSMGFDQYVERVLGSGDRRTWDKFVEKKLASVGISLLDPDRLFTAEDNEKVEHAFDSIKAFRESKGTYRDDDQCRTEAEIDHIIDLAHSNHPTVFADFNHVECVRFVSQSRVLENVDRHEGGKSNSGRVWRPETLFRYLSCFSRATPQRDIWQQFISSDVYQAGIPIIDETKYKRFFSGVIRQSEMDFEAQKRTLEKLGQATFANKVSDDFNSVSEFEKPLFVETLEAHLERLIGDAKLLTPRERKELKDFREREKARKDFIRRQRRRINPEKKK
ncbi:MAG: SIR2 family protein [Elusimicrobia bacterium]|nr:SIR2 family protein [Elusimicrobiota bacterium]